LDIFSDPTWQVALGERAAIEGVLVQRRPKLAIEVGRGDGGSLHRIAAHSEQVHSFDSTPPPASAAGLSNVTHHTGDRHQLLPALLDELAEQESNVDFVLVEGDVADGVRRDLDDLLLSPALADTVILISNTMDGEIRAGADAVPFAAHPKVAHVNLDFVPGYLLRESDRAHELGGGLGLVMIDATRKAYFPATPVVEDRYYEAGHLYREIRDLVAAREQGKPSTPAEARKQRTLQMRLTETRAERDYYKDLYDSVVGSISWRLTAPLRAAKAKRSS
jgi:hypothetical protein